MLAHSASNMFSMNSISSVVAGSCLQYGCSVSGATHTAHRPHRQHLQQQLDAVEFGELALHLVVRAQQRCQQLAAVQLVGIKLGRLWGYLSSAGGAASGLDAAQQPRKEFAVVEKLEGQGRLDLQHVLNDACDG